MALNLLVLAALLGIVVLTPLLIELRLYLVGSRFTGIGPILIDALILAQFLLLGMFAWVIARVGGWYPGDFWNTAIKNTLAVAFAVKPWVTYFRILRWKAGTPSEPRPGGIV